MQANFNKLESISTVDYPGKSSCVIFFNGCPLRCNYCHNKQTWTEENMVNTNIIKDKIIQCLPFISAVTFSGGEPTMQIEPLFELCWFAKEAGLQVAVETSGFYPENMLILKDCVDMFFVDIKAPLDNNYKYSKVTGIPTALRNLNLTLDLDLPIEIRVVDTGNAQEIISSIKTKHKLSILPYIKRE